MNLRTHISKQGTLFLAGRSDANNEELIAQVKPKEEVFHTKAPGSPFLNIKGIPKHGDIKEAAIMCARYSRDWKQGQEDIMIHRFLGKDIHKSKSMKTGTFGVRAAKIIKVSKIDIINFEATPAKKGQLMEFEKQDII
ncbi:MAG: NFACT RNA binding domain-containing protein [Nanoarchaeota archaeon]|jgi:predicted ribosome quality control (RQC) complex YloA/Tae2 family protein|nr:NFACT RNA binding domain-containing protein [Nanoarchaeota archaeon]